MRLFHTDKKYRLTRKYIIIDNNIKLYQIKALKHFSDVHKGQLGGYVQSENNLSQFDDCWIYDEAMVYENAYIDKKACIYNQAKVHGNAVISDNAHIYHQCEIDENVCVYDYAMIEDFARISSYAVINCHAHITKNALIKNEHDFYTDYLDSRHIELNRNPITIYYSAMHEVRVVYNNTTYNLQGFIDKVRYQMGFIYYAEDFRPPLVNARRRMYFKDTI